jgi:effector-binding domain-containing protein
MFDQPIIEERSEQAYAGVATSITMDGYSVIGGLFGELFDWLGARDIEPTGPPFIRYLVIDMDHELEIHVGVPVAGPLLADGRILSATLPSGSYVTLTYRAESQEEHIAANAHLQRWVQEQGLHWKNSVEDGRELWGGRFEITPDPSSDEGGDSYVAYLIEQ